ncbi:MAG: hypothetical protein ABIG66_01025 [Candidatus Kerfeldbacteria bacterium]
MPHQELIDFIKVQSQKGVERDEIERALIENGWEKSDIDEAMASSGLASSSASEPVAAPKEPMQPAAQPLAEIKPVLPATPPIMEEPIDILDTTSGPAADLQLPGTPAKAATPASEEALSQSLSTATATATAAMPKTQKPEYVSGLSRKSKGLLVTVAVVLLLSIGGGSVYAYYYLYASPARIMKNTMENVANLSSANFIVDVSVMELDGAPQDPAARFNITGALEGLTGSTPLQGFGTLVVAAPGADKLSIELRLVQQMLYVKAAASDNAISGLPFPDSWLQIDANSAKQLFGESNPVIEVVDEDGTQQLSEEDRTLLVQAFRNASIITITGKAGEEDIMGTNTSILTFEIDKEGLKAFVTEISPLLMKYAEFTQEQVTGLRAGIDEMEMTTGKLWIDTSNFQLYQVQTVKPMKDANGNVKEQTVTTVTLWNHNDPVDVQVPEDAVSLEEYFKQLGIFLSEEIGSAIEETPELLPGLEEEPNKPVKETDTDGDGLSDSDEQKYGSDINNPDSDGDGFLDGEEVENGYNPNGPGKLK